MATGTTAQQTVDVVTPAAGESVTEGTILEWHTKVGEQIKVDDTIVESPPTRSMSSCPSPASGTVTEILVERGGYGHRRSGDRADRGRRRRTGERSRRGGRHERRCAGGGSALDGRAPRTEQASDGNGQALDGMKVSPVAARAAAVEGVNLGDCVRERSGGTHRQGRRARRQQQRRPIRERPRRLALSRSRARRRCSRGIWTSRGRYRRRRAFARSRSPCWRDAGAS